MAISISDVLASEFVRSWVRMARSGNLASQDMVIRDRAWAHWAISNLDIIQGYQNRQYAALMINGKISGLRDTNVIPHLEISTKTLEEKDPEFGTKLSEIGTGLLTKWWDRSDITASKRALFCGSSSSVGEDIDFLRSYRERLITALINLNNVINKNPTLLEQALVDKNSGFSEIVSRDFEHDEVEKFFPALKGKEMSITYDKKLRDINIGWSTRHLGVWQLKTTTGARWGTITPMMKGLAFVKDPQWLPYKDSASSLLIRCLLLKRILDEVLHEPSDITIPVLEESNHSVEGFLRVVFPQEMSEVSRASVTGATNFVNAIPSKEQGWKMLQSWAENGGYLLTITQEGFYDSFLRVHEAVALEQEPSQDDIDLILPIVWSKKRGVGRATFVSGGG